MVGNFISTLQGMLGAKRDQSICVRPESHVMQVAGGGVGLTAGHTHEFKTFYRDQDGEWKPLPEHYSRRELLNEAGYSRFVTKVFSRMRGSDEWKPVDGGR